MEETSSRPLLHLIQNLENTGKEKPIVDTDLPMFLHHLAHDTMNLHMLVERMNITDCGYFASSMSSGQKYGMYIIVSIHRLR